MEATFDQHIGVFENAVPKEWCENVINLFESNPNLIKSRQELEQDIPPILKKDEMGALQHINKNLCKEFNYFFFNNILPLYSDEYQLKDVIDYEIVVSDYKLQKTKPSGGYHLWHIEHHPKVASNRMLVYTLYLNDVEEGGETEFLLQSKRVKPKQGTICIFPPYYTHIHRGNPPLSGTKYIMTGWVESKTYE